VLLLFSCPEGECDTPFHVIQDPIIFLLQSILWGFAGQLLLALHLHWGFPLATLSRPHMLCAGLEIIKMDLVAFTRSPGVALCQEGPTWKGP